MAFAQLIYRLLGITAICLAAMLVPVSPVQRMLVLTAFSLGVGAASVRPGLDRSAARIVGPAVLVLALAPTTGTGAALDLVAAGVLGFACFNQAGMSRAVPALGLPILTLVFRNGENVPRLLLVLWVIAVVLTILWGSRANFVEKGPRLGAAGQEHDGVVFGRRRMVQTTVAMLVMAPLSVALADALNRAWPDVLIPPTGSGEPSLAVGSTNPGLTSGLDTGIPVALDDEIVLRVKADRPLYWRGATYADWDGRRWTGDVDRREITWSDGGVDLSPLGADDEDEPLVDGLDLPPPITVVQHFRLERGGLDVVLGAARMSALWTSAGAVSIGQDGSVLPDERLGAGATWTVESTVVPATEEDFRLADPVTLPATHPIMQRYGVENDIVPEVAELARSITADVPTTYDKIRALEAWMDDNITYTRSIDRLEPGSDAVRHLLFESRQGFCEQIGSALVVMLRSLGIPARLVVGYVPGEYDGVNGEWLSRSSDAHAWAEVYFPGIGWQGFDPTAGVPLASDDVSPGLLSTPVVALTLAAGVVGLIALAVHHGASSANRYLETARARFGRRATQQPVAELRRRFERCATRLGLTFTSAMTTREQGEVLVGGGADTELVRSVVVGFEQILYSGFDRPGSVDLDLAPLAAAVAALEASVEAVRRAERVPAPAPT